MNNRLFIPNHQQSGWNPAGSADVRSVHSSVATIRNTKLRGRQHWMLYAVVSLIWGLALVRVCVDPVPRVPILFNWSASVPYTVALMQCRPRQPLARGDFIVYQFDGAAQRRYPGLHAQPFFKQIGGMPGDRVAVIGRHVYVNGHLAGIAKPFTFDRQPLSPIRDTVIPPGYYYVQGSHPDSFDSRYRESGLVRADRVVGKVTPLF